jgi:uncharacterized membrane protein
MENKQQGLLVAAIGVILIVLMTSLIPVIRNAEASDCGCSADGGTCQYVNRLPFQFYLGFSVVGILFYLSYTLVTKDNPKKKQIKIPDNLSKEEKQIIDEIIKQEGMIFQSELVEKLGISKVKVTRLLDKLEGRHLIERRRRGMTNAVILKHKD